jgi:hypothetical protein
MPTVLDDGPYSFVFFSSDGVEPPHIHVKRDHRLVLEVEPNAVEVSVTEDDLIVRLADGRRIYVPLAWYPRLFNATERELGHWQIFGDGYAIEWPDLDEHIGIEGLLAGRPSGESPLSLKRWLESRGIKPGQ